MSAADQPQRAWRSTRDGGHWEFARDGKGGCPVKDRINIHTIVGTKVEQAVREAELGQHFQDAADGRLQWGADVKAVRRESGLYEIRWTRATAFAGEERPVHFRMYFAEPPEVDGLLLGLWFHKKAFKKLSAREKTAAQDAEIGHAAALLKLWRSTRGIGTRRR